MPYKFPPLSYWCVIFTINLAEQRHVGEWGRDGVMFMCAHVYDVALCGSTVRNVALGLWLVGRPWTTCFALFEWFVWAELIVGISDATSSSFRGGAIFMKFQSMTSSYLFNCGTTFSQAVTYVFLPADTKSIVQTHIFCTTLANKNRQNRTFCNSVGGWITDVMRNF